MANCERPKCDAFDFGRFHRQPNKVKTIKKHPMKEQELKKYHIMAVKMVSSYHYI